jgi:hypothetical protein
MKPITFSLYYGGHRVACAVHSLAVAGQNGYEVYFDDRLVAGLLPDKTTVWRQVMGAPLDTATIELIGKKIEKYYS